MHMTLFSDDRKFSRTVPILRDDNNVYDKSHAYCAEAGLEDAQQHEEDPLTVNDLTTEDPQTVSDNDEEDEPMHEAINGDNHNEHDESNDEELDDQ